MKKEEINNGLVGMSDLAKRWNYSSVHGVRKRRKYDKDFPRPIAIVNSRVLVFWLPDIEAYENKKGGIDVSQKRYAFYENLEEWNSKTREEKEKQRGRSYSDEEWEAIQKQVASATLPIGNV